MCFERCSLLDNVKRGRKSSSQILNLSQILNECLVKGEKVSCMGEKKSYEGVT